MYARIINSKVAELTAEMPQLAPGECAHIEVCGPEVGLGWTWTPEGFVPPPAPDPYVQPPEYLDVTAVNIGQAERLYAAAQREAAVKDAEGNPGDGPATVLLELLGL